MKKNPIFNTTLEKVTEAILPMKEVAEEQAVKVISGRIEEMLHTLEKDFNWDRRAMSPYPSAMRLGRIEYMNKLSKYTLLSRITSAVGGPCRSFDDPDFCERDNEKIARVLTEARDMAAATFEAYAYKLATKIGTDVVSAVATSENDLWLNSTLSVYHEDGAFTVWNTKTIINCSVYGKLFLQWPTRKAKK